MKWVLIIVTAIAVTLADETDELSTTNSKYSKEKQSDKSLHGKSVEEDYKWNQNGFASENVFDPASGDAIYARLTSLKNFKTYDAAALKTIDNSATVDSTDSNSIFAKKTSDINRGTGSQMKSVAVLTNSNDLVDSEQSNAGPETVGFSQFNTITNIPAFRADNLESTTVTYNGEPNIYTDPIPNTNLNSTETKEKQDSLKEARVYGTDGGFSEPIYSTYSDFGGNSPDYNLFGREFLYGPSPILNGNIGATATSNEIADKTTASTAAKTPTNPTVSVPSDAVTISNPEIMKPTGTKPAAIATSILKLGYPSFLEYTPAPRPIAFSPSALAYDPQFISSSFSNPTFSYPLPDSFHSAGFIPFGDSIASIGAPLIDISSTTQIPSFQPVTSPSSELVNNGFGPTVPSQSAVVTNPSFNPTLNPAESITISGDSISVSAVNLTSTTPTMTMNTVSEFSQPSKAKTVENVSTDLKSMSVEPSYTKKSEQDTLNDAVNTERSLVNPSTATFTLSTLRVPINKPFTGTSMLTPTPLYLTSPSVQLLYGNNWLFDTSQPSLSLYANNQGIHQNYLNGLNSHYNTFPSALPYSTFDVFGAYKKKRSS